MPATRCVTRWTSRVSPTRLGYTRYWLAEHHGTPMLACAAPEVLIGPVARETTRIRVGSGGIMLPHYSPLKVAETFAHAERARAGADRSRAGPRRRHRSGHHLRAAARSSSAAVRTTFRSSSWSCSAIWITRCRPTIRSRGCGRCTARRAAGAVAARIVAAERDLGRGARAAVRLRRLHQPGGRPDHEPLHRGVCAAARRAARLAARSGGGVGAVRRDRCRGPADLGQRAHGLHAVPAW